MLADSRGRSFVGKSESLRLFVAICLPDELKVELGRAQRELRDVLPPHSASWTRPDNMHLTLRFLGDVEAGRMAEVKRAFHAAATGQGELDLQCERLGCFPDLRFPRVVWAWVHDEDGRLEKLAQRVNEAMTPFAGRPSENLFTGHITLARPKRINRADAGRLAEYVGNAVTRRFGRWHAGEVELVSSKLSPGGSCYSTLARSSLRPVDI